LTPNDRLILIGILAIVMSVVVIYELLVIRRKSKEARFASQKKDAAYNDILTTRSVMNSLRNQGRDTGNAAQYLDSAKRAMGRGDFDECESLCLKARGELTNPKDVSPVTGEPQGLEEGDELQQVAENILSEDMKSAGPDLYKGTKLGTGSEGNYLGAKFEISAAKGDVTRAAKTGADVEGAEELLSQAESAYSAGNYDRALAFASRARRSVSGPGSEEAIVLTPKGGVRSETKPQAEVYDVEEESTPSGIRCKSCGTLMDPTDMFCPSCGSSTSSKRSCKSCGAVAKESDTFCRKCGSRI
jgi:RNA polymerase subunit RPABC4/transcription elongation factor Spt4